MNNSNFPVPFLFSGRIGDIVGRVVNGKQIICKRPGPRKSEPTPRELENRGNWALAIQFLKPIVPLLRKYDEPGGRKGFNKATSLIIRNAIRGNHPNQRIDYSKVVLGEGVLLTPAWFQVESPEEGLLELTWSRERSKILRNKTDRIFVVVYCESMDQFKYELSGPERREKYFLMDVAEFSGENIEVWFGFESATGGWASTSVYAGPIDIL